MSRYNEQHATTMLNALIGTDTLADHDKQIRYEVISELKELLQIEYKKRNIDYSEMCVLDKIIRQLKGEQNE